MGWNIRRWEKSQLFQEVEIFRRKIFKRQVILVFITVKSIPSMVYLRTAHTRLSVKNAQIDRRKL